jgi:two-component system response regulator YesN
LFDQFDHQSEDSQAKTQLAPLLKHVQNHYDQDISLDQAAELCNVSLFHFTKVFKRVMGTTFVDYLTTLRMDHAIALFESTSMNVSEVSQAVGYQDQGYFSKVFKKHTGINPTDYRRKIFQT